MKIVEKATRKKLNVISHRLDGEFKRLQQEKKALQQAIVPDIVKASLKKFGLRFTEQGNLLTVKTKLGDVVIRCANYYDSAMNADTMIREANENVRYMVVVGHVATTDVPQFPMFNLTGTKRERSEDLYKKSIDAKEFGRFEKALATYV